MSNSLLPALLHDLTIARLLMQKGHPDASAKHIDTAIGRISAALIPAAAEVLPTDASPSSLHANRAPVKDCSEQASA